MNKNDLDYTGISSSILECKYKYKGFNIRTSKVSVAPYWNVNDNEIEDAIEYILYQ